MVASVPRNLVGVYHVFYAEASLNACCAYWFHGIVQCGEVYIIRAGISATSTALELEGLNGKSRKSDSSQSKIRFLEDRSDQQSVIA